MGLLRIETNLLLQSLDLATEKVAFEVEQSWVVLLPLNIADMIPCREGDKLITA